MKASANLYGLATHASTYIKLQCCKAVSSTKYKMHSTDIEVLLSCSTQLWSYEMLQNSVNVLKQAKAFL